MFALCLNDLICDKNCQACIGYCKMEPTFALEDDIDDEYLEQFRISINELYLNEQDNTDFLLLTEADFEIGEVS